MGELDLSAPGHSPLDSIPFAPIPEEEQSGSDSSERDRVSFALPSPRTPGETAGWAVLGLLLAATLIGAVTFDRARLPLLGDEATFALQAASLVNDFDLTYGREDFERFVGAWGEAPEGLILQSRAGGKLVYGKPPLYALAIAPFVAVAPVRGGPIANAFFLAVAALLAARSLRGRIGGAAPWWVAAFLFASIAFAYVFWGEVDAFLLAATAAGFALVYGDETVRGSRARESIYQGDDGASPRRSLLRWLAAGALLAFPVVFRPFYLVLFLPAGVAALSAPRGRRGAALGALLAGALAVCALSAGLQHAAGGDWTGYGGDRRGLYGADAARAVDLSASRWQGRSTAAASRASWLAPDAMAPRWDLRLQGWNALYFLIGRNAGVLPLFLPLLLGFLAYGRERGRWLIPWAVLLAAAAFLLVRPFNFFGGGPLGNRYFLPLYPALWFLAARPARAIAAFAVALLAAPFLAPLWLAPRAVPVEGGVGYRHVSRVARRLLPYETTQSSLPGIEAAAGGGLWAKVLDSQAWVTPQGRFRIVGDRQTEILLASPQPLDTLHLEFDARAPSHLEVGGQTLGPLLLKPDGGIVFAVPVGRPRATHPTWWSAYDHSFYFLSFRLPGAATVPIGFRIRPAQAVLLEKSKGR
jgi:hypothetical protein